MNQSMLMDFYELTMANGYYHTPLKDAVCYFDLFYRTNPNDGGYAIFCGLESIVEYINQLHFTKEDVEFLRSKNTFSEEFLDYLLNFKFTGDIYGFKEGSIIFPNEPIITVKATTLEAQLIETYLLLIVNHQSLIATTAKRIVVSAQGKPVLEFGSRRAHGASSAVLGARAAYIAGCVGTACTVTDQLYGVPAIGTMAHSWVQMFDSEIEAFTEYCKRYPNNATLLVDTYDVLNSGIPNAIKAFDTVLKPLGITKCGIRIDSGDITYLSRKARKMLDAAGWTECKICISNSLDEHIIMDVLNQGAKIDTFGVGEKLITSKADPVFGGVYKLVAVEKNEEIVPKIKKSENIIKITNPGYKKVYRIYEEGKMIADLIALHDEVYDGKEPLTIFDEQQTWKKRTFTDYVIEEQHVVIFKDGKQVYELPSTEEVKEYCNKQYSLLWDEVTRFTNPHKYYVDLSEKLYNLKYKMLEDIKN